MSPAPEPDGVPRAAGVRDMGIREVLAMAAFAQVAYSGLKVALTLMTLHIDGSAFAVGLAMSIFGAFPMLLAVSGGRWIDRVGVRVPMTAGLALFTVGASLPFAWPALPAVYLGAALAGSGFLPFHVGLQKHCGDIGGPEHQRRNFSLYAIGFALCSSIGPPITGFVIDWIGHRHSFGMLTAIALVGVAWMLLRRESLPSRGAGGGRHGGQSRIVDLLRVPELRRTYVVILLIAAGWDVHLFAVPLYGTAIGFSASQIGLLLGAFAAATLVVRLIVPLFLLDVPEWPVIVSAMAFAAASFVFYPVFGAFEAMLALSFLLGLGLGVAQPLMLSLLARASPGGRLGETAGLRMMIVMGAQGVIPVAFGALGAAFGLASMFWVIAAMLGVGAGGIGRATGVLRRT